MGEGNMRNNANTAGLMANRWSLAPRDLLIVSVFGMWSAVLGLSPILLLRALAIN
jgi:hypothetical protein